MYENLNLVNNIWNWENLNILIQVLDDLLCCNLCGGQVNEEGDNSARNGLAAKIIMNCKRRKSLIISKQYRNNLHEVNIRLF